VRDAREALNYFRALEYGEEIARPGVGLTREELQSIHGLIMSGEPKARPYRDGQYAVRDGVSGEVVYRPPDPEDIPRLVDELLQWAGAEIVKQELPVPLTAGLFHYLLAALHPWYDGNGRTSRLSTSVLLRKGSYELRGLYSLEACHANHLGVFNQSLIFGPAEGSPLGGQEMQISLWLEYFCTALAEAFRTGRDQALASLKQAETGPAVASRKPDARQRQVLALFETEPSVTTKQIADTLGLHRRTALNLCHEWVREGFLVQFGAARKSRRYELGAMYAAESSPPQA
jgi:Fic family protein